jgi:hypothetical protein
MSKISLIEYGSRLWTYAASTEAEPGQFSRLRPSLRPAFISLAMAFLSSEKEYGSRLWTYPASTEAEPGHLFSLSPAFFSLAMAFLSSEKEYGSCLWTYPASTEAEPGKILSSPPGFLFARNGVPFVRKRTWKHFEEKFQECGTRPWTYPASTEAEPGHFFFLRPSLRPASLRSQWRSFRQK